MSQTVELPWGAGSLKVLLPETWMVLGELKPRSHKAPADPAEDTRGGIAKSHRG